MTENKIIRSKPQRKKLVYPKRKSLIINDITLSIMIKDYNQLTKGHIESLRKYDMEQKAKGNSENTRINRLQFLMLFARETGKEFEDVTREDINEFLGRKKLTESTLNGYKEQTKHFFKWMGEEKMVTHLKQIPVDDFIDSKELWNEGEIKQLINTATHPRDKCLVAMLYDLAIERKTIHKLNIGDIENINSVVYITVTGKKRGSRRKRRLQCISSAPYVVNWLNCHPYKDNPDAPFFISFSGNSYGKRVTYGFAYEKLKFLAKETGIKKKIWTHLIRHSKLTDLHRKGFRGVAMQRYAGWVNGNMEQRYINLSTDEIDAERMAIEKGVEYKPPELKPSEMLGEPCPRCQHINVNEAKYCAKCWLPLNVEVSVKESMIIELMRSEFFKSMMEMDGKVDVEKLSEEYDELLKESNKMGRKKISK